MKDKPSTLLHTVTLMLLMQKMWCGWINLKSFYIYGKHVLSQLIWLNNETLAGILLVLVILLFSLIKIVLTLIYIYSTTSVYVFWELATLQFSHGLFGLF